MQGSGPETLRVEVRRNLTSPAGLLHIVSCSGGLMPLSMAVTQSYTVLLVLCALFGFVIRYEYIMQCSGSKIIDY